MSIARTAVTALISGLLIGSASAPLWSAMPTSEALTVAQATSASAALESATAALRSQDSQRSDARGNEKGNCKPGHMYTAHDIVGDPEACIKGGVIGFGARPTVGAVPAF
jgi:hypothetical protein